MDLTHILAFNLALLAAIASPGPAFLYILRMTLSGGRAAGIATGCGLGLMAATWTLAALLGLDIVFKVFPWAYTAFKVGGAAYLIWIAWTAWRDARKPVDEIESPRARAFWGGFLVNLANPKSVLFSAAVLVVVFPPGLVAWEAFAVFANHLVLEITCYTVFAIVMSGAAVRARYMRAKPVLDRIAAGVLGALGLRLLADR